MSYSEQESQNETNSLTQLTRPDCLIPPDSPLRSLSNENTFSFTGNHTHEGSGSGRITADGDDESPADNSPRKSKSPTCTQIFNSPMNSDNQKLSELLVEFAEKEDGYVGSEVVSKFAVWEKQATSMPQDEYPSPSERPVLYVREDGTPTPGILEPFWNRSTVISGNESPTGLLVEKDGPGNKPPGKAKATSIGRKNPVTVGFFGDQMFAINNGLVKEEGCHLHYWHKEFIMQLIAGEDPSVVAVTNPHEDIDTGSTNMRLSDQISPKGPEDSLKCHLGTCSETPVYLVLDYTHQPKLMALTKNALVRRLEEMKSKGSTLSDEKITPLVNISKIDSGGDFTVALYFKVGDNIHYVHVNNDKKLTIQTSPLVEKDVHWRKHLEFTDKSIADSTDGPESSKDMGQTPEEAQKLVTISGKSSSDNGESESAEVKALKESLSVQEPQMSPPTTCSTEEHGLEETESAPQPTAVTNHDHNGVIEINSGTTPESPTIVKSKHDELKSNGAIANGVPQ